MSKPNAQYRTDLPRHISLLKGTSGISYGGVYLKEMQERYRGLRDSLLEESENRIHVAVEPALIGHSAGCGHIVVHSTDGRAHALSDYARMTGKLGWQTRNRLGHWFVMSVFVASEASMCVNTCRPTVTDQILDERIGDLLILREHGVRVP